MKKNLQSDDALSKFKELVEDIRVCMFITNNKDELYVLNRDNGQPLPNAEVQLWQQTYNYTNRNYEEEIASEGSVHLVYSHPGKESYLDVWGTGEVVNDKQTIKDKWKPIVKAWFPNGVDDPNLALLKIRPGKSYYWDATSGKMVQFIKMAASIATGAKLAEGKEGKLSL